MFGMKLGISKQSMESSRTLVNAENAQWKSFVGNHPERFGPFGYCGPPINPTGVSGKSAMEMRESGNVPGARGEGARQETAGVTDNLGNNHVDDLLRKPGCRR